MYVDQSSIDYRAKSIRSIAASTELSVDGSIPDKDTEAIQRSSVPTFRAVRAWEALRLVAQELSNKRTELILEGRTNKSVPHAEAEAFWDSWVSGR